MSVTLVIFFELTVSAICKAIRDTQVHHRDLSILTQMSLNTKAHQWVVGQWKWKYIKGSGYTKLHWYAGILAPISDLWHTCWTVENLVNVGILIWLANRIGDALPTFNWIGWLIIFSLYYAAVFNVLYGWALYVKDRRVPGIKGFAKALFGV